MIMMRSAASCFYLAASVFLASCGQPNSKPALPQSSDEQAESDRAAKEVRRTEELRVACSESYDVAENVYGEYQDFLAAVETAHEPEIAKADREYEQTIGASVYQVTAEGLGEALRREDATKQARIDMLTEQRTVAEAFQPLKIELDSGSQTKRVASAAGARATVSEECARAQEALDVAKKSLVRARKASPAVRKLANDHIEIVEAALSRIHSSDVAVQ